MNENDIYNIEVVLDNGLAFHNLYDCARYLKVQPEDALYALNNGTSVGDYCLKIYLYNDNLTYSSDNRVIARKQNIDITRWSILNEDTGVIYKNGSDCARKIGVNRSMVSMCLNGERKTCRGFHLRRV